MFLQSFGGLSDDLNFGILDPEAGLGLDVATECLTTADAPLVGIEEEEEYFCEGRRNFGSKNIKK